MIYILAMDTQEITGVKITDETDGTVVATRGTAMVNGSTVVIYDWDPERHRNVRIDRVTGAELKRHKTVAHVKGVSQRLVREMGVATEDAHVAYKLEFGKGRAL